MISEDLLDIVEAGYETLHDYKQQVRTILTTLYKEEIAAYPAPIEEKHVDLIVAIKPFDLGGLLLLKCEGTAVSDVKYFEMIGAGRAVRYELEQLYQGQEISLRQGIIAAIHVLRTASTALHIVGGRSSVATITYDGRLAVESDWRLYTIDTFLWSVRHQLGKILLKIADGTLSREQFAEALKEFNDIATSSHDQLVRDAEYWDKLAALANPQVTPLTSQTQEPEQ